jgi:calcineurin-like phosphoesterase family protein
MTLFFTADTHFGDHRTINIWGRHSPHGQNG